MAAGKTYEQIAWTSLGSATNTITFSSIASSWTDLRLVFTGLSTLATPSLNIRFNSDATNNYSTRVVSGDGASAVSNSQQNNNYILGFWYGGLSTTYPSTATMDVLQYANTGVYKTLLFSGANDKNGSGNAQSAIGLWRSTAAINRIDIIASVNNFTAGSTAALYGIAKA